MAQRKPQKDVHKISYSIGYLIRKCEGDDDWLEGSILDQAFIKSLRLMEIDPEIMDDHDIELFNRKCDKALTDAQWATLKSASRAHIHKTQVARLDINREAHTALTRHLTKLRKKRPNATLSDAILDLVHF